MSKLPTADVALVTIDHPVLAKAKAMFDTKQASCEGIAPADDEVFCKVKITRPEALCGATSPSSGSVPPVGRKRGTPMTSMRRSPSGVGRGERSTAHRIGRYSRLIPGSSHCFHRTSITSGSCSRVLEDPDARAPIR